MQMSTHHRLEFGQPSVHSIVSDLSGEVFTELFVEGVFDKVDMTSSVLRDKIKIANKHIRFCLTRFGTEEFAGARGPAKQEPGVGSVE